MENKINIAELLKDCPKGIELYSPIYGLGILTKVTDRIHVKFPKEHNVKCFRPDGKVSEDGEIMLYPKGKTTWEGFVPPCKFKDGDVITCTNSACSFVAIFKEMNTDTTFRRYVSLTLDDEQQFWAKESWSDFRNPRLATEEEKQKLFDAIKANGYRWDSETKTLEKLIEPIFKVGSKIKDTRNNSEGLILKITNEGYECHFEYGNFIVSFKDQNNWKLVPKFKKGDNVKHKESGIYCTIGDYAEGLKGYYTNIGHCISDNDVDNWELIPNKFDIHALKPFDKVLVRVFHEENWKADFFSHYTEGADFPYNTISNAYRCYCIPYKGNEYLLGTSDDCKDYYKTWEE